MTLADEPTTFHGTVEHWLYRNHEIEVEIFDTAGQRAFETLRGLAYHGANIFVLSYDVGNEASLENIVNKWIPEESHPHFRVALLGDPWLTPT